MVSPLAGNYRAQGQMDQKDPDIQMSRQRYMAHPYDNPMSAGEGGAVQWIIGLDYNLMSRPGLTLRARGGAFGTTERGGERDQNRRRRE